MILIMRCKNTHKMGVDFYNCHLCNEIYASGGYQIRSWCCDETSCGMCTDNYLIKVPVECDGECVTHTEDERPVDEQTYEGDGCKCHEAIKKARVNIAANFRDEFDELPEDMWLCRSCLVVKDPYEATDDQVTEFLVKKAGFTSFEEVLDICRQENKRLKLTKM